MADKIHSFERPVSDVRQYWLNCPGCRHSHAFTVGPQRGGWGTSRWEFNGSMDKPTFTPSLLCNPDHPDSRCHSFVSDGRIQFLSDCWHNLAGQTVDIPDWDDEVYG